MSAIYLKDRGRLPARGGRDGESNIGLGLAS
jgi:hypothetical protein